MRVSLPAAAAIAATVATSLACPVWAGEGKAKVLFDMEAVRHRPTAGADKTPIGTAKLVEGKVGKACEFTFKAAARSGFFTASVRPSPAWDQAAGLSFWVKGDGSSGFGGLELIDASNYALRYGYCFPIDSTEWRKVTVPWCDLVPELPAGQPVGGKGGYSPSRFGNVWFGKWYYWRDYPACSFAVDQICLEPRIKVDKKDYTPAEPGTPLLRAKLKAGRPVTIVTMGDSLCDRRHWANRKVLWSQFLAESLTKRFAGKVTLVNPAIGGTLLTQNLVLMPRWLKDTPRPDLVTVWFGFNDWSSGMRGPHFGKMLRFAVDRIRRMTAGRSEVMLITTCPALSRWDTMEELARAVRAVAAEKKTALADISAGFHKAGADTAARAKLFVRDKTHLAPAGHQLAARIVFEALTGAEGRAERAAR